MDKQAGLVSLTLSKAMEVALNEAIRLDEMQGRAFEPLEDSVIALHLTDLQQRFYLLFTSYGVSVSHDLQGGADSQVDSNLMDLIALANNEPLPNSNISGNPILGEQFIHALATLEIDWEEHLSHYTGDLVAFKIGHGVRSLLKGKQAAKQQAGDTLKEYLQFELNAVPTRSQVDFFNQQVTQTSSELEQIEQRIEALLKSQ